MFSNAPATTTENRLFLAYWQDGSVDFFAGLGALAIGFAWVFDVVWLGPIAPALLIPVWIAFRRQVVEPRLGQVRFQPARQRRVRNAHLAMMAAGSVTLLLGVVFWFVVRGGGAPSEGLRRVVPALPAVLLGFGGMLAAAMLGLGRFAGYGVVFILAGVAVAWLEVDPGWALLVGGLATFAAGASLFVRFLRGFPTLPAELD